jgi:hypothetical protein
MEGACVKLSGGRQLHHPTEVENQNAVAEVAHDGEIVADEQDRHAVRALEIQQECYDLLLDGDIQSADGLVAHEHAGLQDHGTRDTNALALATTELVGVAIGQVRRQAHPDQHLCDSPAPGRSVEIRTMQTQRLGDDLADGHPGVQAGQRVLKDDLQVLA